MFTRALALAALASPSMAVAATADITVRGAGGQPLVDAVVLIDSPKAPSGPIKFPWPNVMAQENISFQPHVLIVPVGATVAFPNRDRVRHHVYSASRIARFDIKLYGRDETRTQTFEKPGPVALGCNIHDTMSGFVYVTTTPYAARTDTNGHVSIPGVPVGGATLRIWHPSLRIPNNEMAQNVSVAASGLTMTVTTGGR